MNISPTEAEEALLTIQTITKKTRRLIAASGSYRFLLLWGFLWLFGFLGSQFLSQEQADILWAVLDTLGGVLSALFGVRMGRAVRGPFSSIIGKRIGWFWLLLMLYTVIILAIVQPIEGKQLAMIITLAAMLGWVALGLWVSPESFWGGLAITVIALIGYFLLPGIFYLWMAVFGGGGMIALGLYIRRRW